jgi:hypothetical protein
VSNSRALESLEHCWTSSSSCEAFVTLGGLPPRRQVFPKSSQGVVSCGTICKGRVSPPKGKELSSGSGKGLNATQFR